MCLPSHHPGLCCTLVVVEEIPPFQMWSALSTHKCYINYELLLLFSTIDRLFNLSSNIIKTSHKCKLQWDCRIFYWQIYFQNIASTCPCKVSNSPASPLQCNMSSISAVSPSTLTHAGHITWIPLAALSTHYPLNFLKQLWSAYYQTSWISLISPYSKEFFHNVFKNCNCWSWLFCAQ